MKKYFQKQNNCAYIDGANLHKGIASLGWTLDYGRFRVWLSEKYKVRVAQYCLRIRKKNARFFSKERICL